MKVLVIGGGGREHAIAWRLAASSRVEQVFVAPGNGGTDAPGGEGRAPMRAVQAGGKTPADWVALAQELEVGFTFVGPEDPLCGGVVDAFVEAGLRCFGPVAAAARLEGSKAFSKAFMARHGIPTARHAVFTEFEAAREHLAEVDYPVVVKASGLAAGKGVIVPEDDKGAEDALRAIMVDRSLGGAGDEVVIEERLTGQETSIMAFCDGDSYRTMPASQDHKRVFDGDEGPNTGGMGAYSPVPFATSELVAQVEREVMAPTLAGMREEGSPFVGILYAGLMLTDDGPKVLEFNVRLGDPETQVILPLLETDLLGVAEACVDGRLGDLEVRWHGGAAATVVAAAPGYPERGYPKGMAISGLDEAEAVVGVTLFHAGTARDEAGDLISSGGRVLAVTGQGDDLRHALGKAYEGLARINFEGLHHRTDIGARALSERNEDVGSKTPGVRSRPPAQPGEAGRKDKEGRRPAGNMAGPEPWQVPCSDSKYREAGVNIDAGDEVIRRIKSAVKATQGPEVLAGVGAFGGLFDGGALKAMEGPVLVASTDGVGTKTKIATALGIHDTIGHDIVNHCVDDILVQGARPLFFLDYFASAELKPEVAAAVISGAAQACAAAGCALLGGETAEMPGVYVQGEMDLVGTVVGMVERERIITGEKMAVGDVVIGLPSSGLHTNGFSLARKVFEGFDLGAPAPGLGRPLGEALLEPHRCYAGHILRLDQGGLWPNGLVHITGGGLLDNPVRVLPGDVALRLERGAWEVPPLFRLIQQEGGVTDLEMARVFNMGLGMLVVLPAADADRALELMGEGIRVGEIVPRGDGPAVILE